MVERPPLLDKLFAYRLSQAISTAATLGIADLLAEGPRDIDDLAHETGTHAPSLYRLLRALAAERIFEELPNKRFAQSTESDALRDGSPQSLRGWAMFVGRPYYWRGWGNLLHSVQTGGSGVEHELGMNSWQFRADHPEESAVFDRAMTEFTRLLLPAVRNAVDWGAFSTIVDVAGGHGAQLADILASHPDVRGILFDQPHVVAGAPPVLAAAGVAARCEVVGGSFFESVPAADAYILKHILHDWHNEECQSILRVIAAAAPPGGRLFVIERLIGGPNEDWNGKVSDLNMLVGPGGMERTLQEFEVLLTQGGWSLRAAHAAGTHHVIEADRA